MKRTGYIILTTFLILIGVPLILLNTPSFQQKIIHAVSQSFAEKSGTIIEVKSAGVNPFRGIVLHGVTMRDSTGVPFLKAERMEAGIRILPLFRRRIDLSAIRCIRADVILYKKTPEDALNVLPFIHSFSSKKKAVLPWHYNFRTILFKNCRIFYDVLSEPRKSATFDSNHLRIINLSSLIRLKVAPKSRFEFKLVKFSADECCGITVKNFSLKGKVDSKNLTIEHIRLLAGNSELEISSIDASYSSFKAFKHLSNAVSFAPMVIKTTFIPSDFSVYHAPLSKLTTPVILSLSLEGKINDLNVNSIRLSMENLALFDGKFNLNQLTDLSNLSVNGKVNLLKIYPAGFEYLSGIITKKQTKLPALRALGTISYMGNVSTTNHRIEVKGDFKTEAGTLETNLAVLLAKKEWFQFEGKMQSTAFQLNRLSNAPTPFGKIAFNLAVKGMQKKGTQMAGTVDGLISELYYHGYTYKNLSINGSYSHHIVDGKLLLNDENAKLDLNGQLDLSKNAPACQLSLLAKNINLQALRLVNNSTISDLSFDMNAAVKGHTIDDMTGILTVNDLAVYNNKQWFHLDKLVAEALQEDTARILDIRSDLLNGNVSGKFYFNELNETLHNLLTDYIPSAFTVPSLKKPRLTSHLDFHFSLAPSTALTDILELPFSYNKTIHLDGYFRNSTGKFRVKAVVPDLTYGKLDFHAINFLFENPLQEAKFIGHAQVMTESQDLDMDMDVRTFSDQSAVKFFWSNSGTETHTGTINGNVLLSRDKMGKPVFDISLLPSEIVVSDTIWHAYPTRLKLENKRFFIDQFELSHNDEFIKLNGYISKNLNDTLAVSFNSFRLDDLISLLPKGDITFGGSITGTALCPHLLNKATLNAALDVKGFSINKQILGNLNVTSYWNDEAKALELYGHVLSSESTDSSARHVALATGSYFPFRDSLYLNIDSKQLPLNFLDVYLDAVLKDLQGYATGNIKIMGPIKKIGIYTKVFIKNASFSIGMLNTRYSFSDSLNLTPHLISFRNVQIKDKEGNTAIANGLIKHNYFKNMQTNIKISAKNLLAMDIPQSSEANFYGKAYGSGTVTISGSQDNMIVDVNMHSEDHTKVAISLLKASDVEDYNFIQFINPRTFRADTTTNVQTKKQISEKANTQSGNLTVNLQLEVTPSAELTLITDPNTGDEIKARGSGAIRSVFKGGTGSDIQLFGRYTIDNGSYKFVYENILRRDFKIIQGGTINFAGDPFAAELDIKANYTVDALLTDLIPAAELASLHLNRNRIPVNCVLGLNGELQQPGITLDLNYPSADEELTRRINNVINTDEQKNQQLVYLLLFGRFNSPSNIYTASQSNVSTVLNTAISTLSSQVNRVLNNAFGYSNMSFDIDYKNSAYESGTPGEFKVGMSGQWLDDRLTFQGNLGSREDLTQTGTSQFIGEFDLSVRMKNSQKWSWKLFNRANDNMYFKSALNTQGFGVVYKEEYNTYSELFKQMIESLKQPFIRKKKQEQLPFAHPE
ncbi:MAG: translocation/assembly module TamB domain-containing protein [Bacteroidota bacterium]|nr:translocation/assembly module TamB domain-containing protein [Bacteroidota bacterium]